MYRNFDNRDRYYDISGKPLSGCVQFMLRDGTTPAAIYDVDGTALANPQLTDILGRTRHQVCVRSDVVAYMYKYVGTGTLADVEYDSIDTSDESKWSLQYTVESIAVDERTVTGSSSMGVPTMSELRALDPAEVPEVYGVKVVCLQGYYELGDKAPVWYVWDASESSNDDNGSVIKCDDLLTGRWILVTPEFVCDSRHFGCFPQDSASSDVDHTTAITQLVTYCNEKSLRPYFGGSASYPYFIYKDISITSQNPYVVDAGTVFVDSYTTSVNKLYGEWCGNPYFLNAKTEVKASRVCHGWHFLNAVGVTDYVCDSDWSPLLLNGVNVIMEKAPAYGTQLTGCTVESVHKIDKAIVFYNMTPTTDWFASGYSWSNLSLYGCRIELSNCDSASTYIVWKNKQNEADYGDLGEQSVSGASLLDNAVAENFTGSVTLLGSAELHNATATVTSTGTTPSLNLIDCWITMAEAQTFEGLQLRRGYIGGAAIEVLTSVAMSDCTMSSALTVSGGSIDFSRVTINANIAHTGNPVVESFFDCVFNAYLAISGGESYSIVQAKWIGNHGNVGTPIRLDRTNLDLRDNQHSYVYTRNTGTFVNTTTVTATGAYDYVPGTPNSLGVFHGGSGFPYGVFAVTTTEDDGTGTYTDDGTGYFCELTLFSIGTAAFETTLDIVPSSPLAGNLGSSNMVSGARFKVSTFDHPILDNTRAQYVSSLRWAGNGYTWKLRNLSLAGSFSDATTLTVTMDITQMQ